MKSKDIEKAILDGITSQGKEPLADEIINEIFDENLHNQEFIETVFDDKSQNATNADKNDIKTDKSENDDDKDKNEDMTENKQEQNLGKFKNPTQLYKAYCELEKEFTKRSQRLRQLESEMASDGAFDNEEQWKDAVDKFFEKTPSAKNFAKEIANKIILEPELKKNKNCLEIALTRVLVDNFKTPEELMSDGQFLKDYVLSNERVKEAVIDAYLKGVRSSQPPVMLTENGMQCVAPQIKPRSIEEAGKMFLKNNR